MTVEDLEMTSSFSTNVGALSPGDSFKNSMGVACVLLTTTSVPGGFSPVAGKSYMVRLSDGVVMEQNSDSPCEKVKLKATPE